MFGVAEFGRRLRHILQGERPERRQFDIAADEPSEDQAEQEHDERADGVAHHDRFLPRVFRRAGDPPSAAASSSASASVMVVEVIGVRMR